MIKAIKSYFDGGRISHPQSAASQNRPSLPAVTLCGVDTDHPQAAILSMRKSMERLGFARAILFTSQPIDAPEFDVQIIPPFISTEDYSRFIFSGEIPDAIDTDFVLITHWDGWVLDGARWSDEFLNLDYIGAPWPWHGTNRVGNGGFCLRSSRLMREIVLMRPAKVHGEDEIISRELRPALEARGLRFSDEDAAWRFAHECGGEGRPAPLGFHGAFNFRRFCSPHEIAEMLRLLPASMRENNKHLVALDEVALRRVKKLVGTGVPGSIQV
jgi:hypothetical protein